MPTFRLIRLFPLVTATVALLLPASLAQGSEVWQVDRLNKIGGHPPEVVGAPQVRTEGGATAVWFDGAHDGIFMPAIPIAGAKAFTIEVLFRPVDGGLDAQRFFHLQDTTGTRALIELRENGKGGWWLDTFLRGGEPAAVGRTLIDDKRVHPTGEWYWVALRYDGTTMTDFVNGEKELEGTVSIAPFVAGRISLGVRQNKVFWFKGAIREVRFHDEALPADKLQRPKRD
jgi:hypothetical protein